MSPVERGPSACQNTYGRVSGRGRSVRRWGSPPSAVLADSPYDTGRIRWSVAFETIAARALTSCHDRCAVADESRELASTEVPPILFRRWGVARRARPWVLVAIACGGALGAVARFKVAQLIPVPKDGFPWATFWINLSGAFVLGFFLALVVERFPPSRFLRPFFAVGFLGAYTTFSTMAVETVTLIKDGRPVLGVAYIVGSVAAGLVVVYIGIVLARLLPLGARGRV
jgi:CrcB protein